MTSSTPSSDVLGDLASGKPMDRLICGDVGFGKTEVALRAAFVMAMSGRQVAVVCPTTLLARQHYSTFVERFKGWPVKVRRLSRLVPAAEAAETREGLAKGEVESRRGDPRGSLQAGPVQGPGDGHRRRGAALRGQAQGSAQGPEGRGARHDPDGHPHSAHAADGALGNSGDVDHRDAAGRPAGRADLRHPVGPGLDPRSPAAREVPRRPGLLRRAADQGPPRS